MNHTNSEGSGKLVSLIAADEVVLEKTFTASQREFQGCDGCV